MRAKEIKRLFVYITVVLFFSAGAVLAEGRDGYRTQPYDSESEKAPQAQKDGPDPGSQKSGGPISEGKYEPGKGPQPAETGPSYRQEGPNNSIKSRWQIDVGGSIKMDVGHSQ